MLTPTSRLDVDDAVLCRVTAVTNDADTRHGAVKRRLRMRGSGRDRALGEVRGAKPALRSAINGDTSVIELNWAYLELVLTSDGHRPPGVMAHADPISGTPGSRGLVILIQSYDSICTRSNPIHTYG